MTQQETAIDRLINEGVPSSRGSGLLFHQVFAQTNDSDRSKAPPTKDSNVEKPPTPPTDLTDGEKAMAYVAEPVASVGGGIFWMSRLTNTEHKSLAANLKGLDRVSHTPAYKDFFKDAPRFAERVEANAKVHLDKLTELQKARPDLFNEVKSGTGQVSRVPNFKVMNDAEQEIVHRSADWRGFSETFSKVKTIEDHESFKKALNGITELVADPAAKARGILRGASRVEALGLDLEQKLAVDSAIKYKAVDAFQGKSIAGVVGGVAVNFAIEHYVLPGSAPGPLTVATDFISPAVAFAPISPIAKAGTIVAAHGIARGLDYFFSPKK